ncbi:hypothetical protein AKJ09_01062 [Labilithrix luteola]|uniref:Uncharacterized protein n=1 Tax=Labilithrix luteola TaxID=1391654 RepID=A0A0K1PLI7_9BACT|nr:hypothetical protein AKJ09_01062 [Labilithrix luteola]
MECSECRGRYGRHLLLSKLDPRAMAREERVARGLGVGRAIKGVPGAVLGPLALAAAFVLLLSRLPSGGDGFAARGRRPMMQTTTLGPEAPSPTKGAVYVHRVVAGGSPIPVTREIHRDDELVFAYENQGQKQNLMIFGVDELGHVYWYFPAWTDARDNPFSIGIDSTPGTHELREAIAHPIVGRKLEIHALFLDSPLSVREVETMIAEHRLDLPTGFEQVQTLQVVP